MNSPPLIMRVRCAAPGRMNRGRCGSRRRRGGSGERAGDPVRPLLPVGGHLPEAGAPEVQARRGVALRQLGGVPARGRGAVAGPARPRPRARRPRGAAFREPPRVGLRRHGHAHRGRDRRPHLPDPHLGAGPLHIEGQRGEDRARLHARPGGEGAAGEEPGDVALSFLPLCHIFERMAEYLMLHHGVTIAYAEGVDQVVSNLAEVRPTLMCSVPRFYEKVHARVREKVAKDPAYRQRLFAWALKVGGEYFRHRVEKTPPSAALRIEHALADRLVFKKIRARVGGRIRVFVSGGAPLAREVAEFFGAAGLLILEGYGLSETSPVIAVNIPDAMRPGTVGRPIPGVEVKIAPDGEILTRGPHVMKGYFRKPEATAAAIDAEGWFHTGDIGHLDADGFLVITDRKKDLIVTSGGKKVAPQPIENRLKTNPFFGEIVIVGNRRNFPAALVVPNFEVLEGWARQRGVPFASREELIERPEVVALYEQLIQEMTPDLAQFEKIKKIALLPREFTLEAGELTPTLKVRRRVVEEKYKDVIDRLYGGAAA